MAVFGRAVRAMKGNLGFWAHAFHEGRNWLERMARTTTPDFAIANSSFTEQGLVNLFPGVPSRVVYPPLALTPLANAHLWRSRLRGELQVSDETVVIVQVSRLEACKGHFLHLEALAELKDLSIPWTCWIVGGAQRPEESEYLRRLKETAETLGIAGRVQFLGQRADVAQLLAAADVFCQPNETPDSFGISFVEALWAGRPVVTTALGGAKEIIDNSCGLLLEPGNGKLLAACLRRLIESPELRAELARGGAARALKLCDPATQMSALSDFSLDVTKGEAGSRC
jgi:glycosyltransferase involved in cell wall biosynthesis